MLGMSFADVRGRRMVVAYTKRTVHTDCLGSEA